MPERHLVLISGPIASGKTTAAYGLAARLRSRGQDAAAIDMDEMIAMVAGEDWSLIRGADRQKACRLTTRLVQTLFDEGAGVVAIAGSTLSPYEGDEVTAGLDPKPLITSVLLRVSLEEAVRRAQADPGRILTKDPAYVAALAARVDWTSVRQHDIELVTDHLAVDEVVSQLTMMIGLTA